MNWEFIFSLQHHSSVGSDNETLPATNVEKLVTSFLSTQPITHAVVVEVKTKDQ